jgi:hypothetical protein
MTKPIRISITDDVNPFENIEEDKELEELEHYIKHLEDYATNLYHGFSTEDYTFTRRSLKHVSEERTSETV